MSFLDKMFDTFKEMFSDSEDAAKMEEQKETKSHEEILESINNKKDAKKALLKAVESAAEDGVITKEEFAEIEQVRNALDMTPEELSNAKVKVFRKVVEKVLADSVVTDEEMELLNDLQSGMKFSDQEMIRLLGDFQKVQLIYQKGLR